MRAGANCSIGANTRDLIIDCILTKLPLLANTNTKRLLGVLTSKVRRFWVPDEIKKLELSDQNTVTLRAESAATRK